MQCEILVIALNFYSLNFILMKLTSERDKHDSVDYNPKTDPLHLPMLISFIILF